MTPEEQRIALAEWEGWTNIRELDDLYTDGEVAAGVWWQGIPPEDSSLTGEQLLPDYRNDLNAVHELEKKLPKETLGSYAMNLSRVVGYLGVNNSVEWLPHKTYLWHATAAQRCEAILKKINLWKP